MPEEKKETVEEIKLTGKRTSPGRPSKLEKRILERLMEAIGKGNTFEASCQYAGISYSTFRNWVLKGEEYKKMVDEGKNANDGVRYDYINFLEELHNAEARAEVKLVELIREIGVDNKDWRALAFILERRYGKDWAKKIHLDEEIAGEFKIVFDTVEADPIEGDNEEEDDTRL